MPRFQHTIIVAFVFIGAGFVYAEPQDFENAPVADFPLKGPSASEVVPVIDEAPDFDTLPSPNDIPLSREALDSTAAGGLSLPSPSHAYSLPQTNNLPQANNLPSQIEPIAPPTGFSSPNAFAQPGEFAPSSELPSSGFTLPSTDSVPVFESPISPNSGTGVSGYRPPSFESSKTGIIESPLNATPGSEPTPEPVDESLVQDGPYTLMPEGAVYTEGEVLFGDGVCGDGTCFDGMSMPMDGGSYGGGWDFGGWLSAGATINDNGNNSANGNAPLGFNNFADGLVLNQAWLYLAKETQTNGYGFDWGFRADLLFGADAPDTQAFGDGSWDSSWDTGGQYGFAMPQLYGEVAINRTKTKFGRFFTNIGYEQVAAPYNFFYSHSLSRYYNQPFTHTGFLTQFNIKPDLILFGGWTAGWDSGFRNRNDGSTFLGGMIWNVSDSFDLMYSTTAGDPGVANASSDVYMHSLIGDLKFGYGWNYVAQWDHQRRRVGGGPATVSNAFNQYLFKQLSASLTAGIRVEYFRDEDGARIQNNGPGDYVGATVGFNWRPFTRMVLRPELRWDSFDGAGQPFNNRTSRDQFTLGMDAVYVF